MRRRLVLTIVLALTAATPAVAQEAPRPAPRVAHYIGTDTNWFNPANWSTGQVPGEDTRVFLDENDEIVIDPTAPDAGNIIFTDLIVTGARMTTQPGTVMEVRNVFVRDGGQLIHQSTESRSRNGNLQIADLSSMTLNASHALYQDVLIPAGARSGRSPKIVFGLAGTEPASPGHIGRGHYATLIGEIVRLGGRLDVELLHGFTPVEGDSFQIITATRALAGQFDGLPEGALVARVDDEHGLFISYGRHDGPTFVTLTLRPLSGR